MSPGRVEAVAVSAPSKAILEVYLSKDASDVI
jgi:hypothetical protein